MPKHNRFQVRKDLDALSFIRRSWEALDTPVSLSCYLLMKYEEYDQLATKSIEPSDYLTPGRYLLDAQSLALITKYPFLGTSFSTKTVALKKFLDCEVQCQETNRRFDQLEEIKDFPELYSILYRAKDKIDRILGPVPELSELDFRFGPGASVGVRRETSVYNKALSTLECTRNMLPILGDLIREHPSLVCDGPRTVNIVEGSELTFVPKSAKTDRPICIEPLLNGFYQKGIGSYLRGRLRKVGVNLRSQETNARLASDALRRQLATVDFASASDTIAYRLVQELLPSDWFELLDKGRCQRYFYKDISGSHFADFEKFSSMGNAFTFELETLIFYALALASMEHLGIKPRTGYNLAVYGDDVILPSAAFDLFSEVTGRCGFSINTEKSFSAGSFYESCGQDFFQGTLVRPFFLKKKIRTVREAYFAANKLLEFSRKLYDCPWLPCEVSQFTDVIRRLGNIHAFVIRCIPPKYRLLVPNGAGDVGLVCDFDIACPPRHKCWDGYRYRQIADLAHKHKISEARDNLPPLFYALYFITGPDVEVSGQSKPGHFYTNRGDSSLKLVNSFWPNHWPLAPFIWSEKSRRLVRT